MKCRTEKFIDHSLHLKPASQLLRKEFVIICVRNFVNISLPNINWKYYKSKKNRKTTHLLSKCSENDEK